MNKIENNKRFNNKNISGRDSIITKKLGNETVLYDPEKKKVHILNQTAFFIWQLCENKYDTKDLVSTILNNFECKKNVKEEKIEEDIKAIVKNFSHQGIL